MEHSFVNAQEMKVLYPDNFEAPTKEELDAIDKGDFVKVCYNRERFWVNVSEVDGDIVKGVIDNDLVQDELKCGDLITFNKANIFNIL